MDKKMMFILIIILTILAVGLLLVGVEMWESD
jgi:hypothetical protein